jgi:hypothetical protein
MQICIFEFSYENTKQYDFLHFLETWLYAIKNI